MFWPQKENLAAKYRTIHYICVIRGNTRLIFFFLICYVHNYQNCRDNTNVECQRSEIGIYVMKITKMGIGRNLY